MTSTTFTKQFNCLVKQKKAIKFYIISQMQHFCKTILLQMSLYYLQLISVHLNGEFVLTLIILSEELSRKTTVIFCLILLFSPF
jgi:hypothetical protein